VWCPEIVTGSHRNDVTQLIPLLDTVPPIRGRVGRPRRKPRMLVADRGYDHEKYRRLLRARGIRPAIARRGIPPPGIPQAGLLPDLLALPQRSFSWEL
jgi:Transposase DDE domain